MDTGLQAKAHQSARKVRLPQREDAKAAGAVGYMARALVNTSMPYRDPKTREYVRHNGSLTLQMTAGPNVGLPFGIYPRLLTTWVATEAVRRQSPVIELGDSLRQFLREVLDLRSNGAGKGGNATRVSDQMVRLFSASIVATDTRYGFEMRRINIVEQASVTREDAARFDALVTEAAGQDVAIDDGGGSLAPLLWVPQNSDDAGRWNSRVELTPNFFEECTTSPVPIDLRAYKSLRESPRAMDLYSWLTYRMSYLRGRSRPIPWEALMFQFGSALTPDKGDQAVRDFRREFLKALKTVLVVYSEAKIDYDSTGITLLPSRPHVARQVQQQLSLGPRAL
jgi:hypothetical protein